MHFLKSLEEVKEHLEKAQNPLFYYDNDADGLCSFLLCRRALGRGKGVAVRSYPDLNESYARKAQELGADYVFILDKPIVSKEFVAAIEKMQIPVVWIDHHLVELKEFESFEGLYLYNSALGNKIIGAPVTNIIYQTFKRKEDLWIAVMGCIADHYLPDFSQELAEQYPELWAKGIKEPFDAYYRTEIGKTAQALNFGLKDSVSNVVQMQNYLISCQSPSDVLAESSGNRSFRAKYEEIKKKYNALIKEAKKSISGKLLFFEYGGDLSISADVSNELSYTYPEIYIAVAYTKAAITNVSLRGRGIKKIVERILPKIEGASGGGHPDAVGTRLPSNELARFKEYLGEEIENEKGN